MLIAMLQFTHTEIFQCCLGNYIMLEILKNWRIKKWQDQENRPIH